MNSEKLCIQMAQLNSGYGRQQYLPYSVGMLASYVKQFEDLWAQVELKPFLYKRDAVTPVMDQIGAVDLLGLSCYMWNFRLNMALAEEARRRHPDCLIVVGGPHVPDRLGDFFARHSYLDIAVHGEGEVTFYEIVKAQLEGRDFRDIPGLSYHDRRTGQVHRGTRRPRLDTLDAVPSPYLTGIFDHLIGGMKDVEWHVMWETNRGCPFSCAFCDWGSAIASKVRQFEMNRLLGEVRWFADHKIGWVFGCDANFGILPRDRELADALARAKRAFGYPQDFRVCFTKNSNNKVFDVAKILHDADMSKGISLSMQSLNADALRNIKRSNIKLGVFHDLQRRYLKEGMATYSELIIGLPGETCESFLEGLDILLDQGQHSGINIYNCSIMPNAEMGDAAYQKQFEIRTIELPIFQAHSDRPNPVDTILEYEPIVIATNTLTVEDWRKTYHFAWAVQCFHLLGSLQAVSIFLRHQYGIRYSTFYHALLEFGRQHPDSVISREMSILDGILDNVLAGVGFNQYLPEFLDINWPAEEASHLRLSKQIETFYGQCEVFLEGLIKERQLDLPESLRRDLMQYQQAVVVHYDRREDLLLTLQHNLPEYIQSCRIGEPTALERGECVYQVVATPQLNGDLQRFAREVVWYGRKGGKFFYPVKRLAAEGSSSRLCAMLSTQPGTSQ